MVTRIRIITIGDANTGKTSCLHRYINNNFDPNIMSTIGLDYMNKKVVMDNVPYEVEVFDTCGQERFYCITKSYYNRCSAALIFCDVTNVNSYHHLEYWYQELLPYGRPIIIVANKCDLPQRVVTTSHLKLFCDNKPDILCFEASALTGHNIHEAFEEAVIKGNNWINRFFKKDQLSDIPLVSGKEFSRFNLDTCCRY